ncbi:hypothetical protein MAR_016115 [Mya arenaria]|uniref:Uncharacterized protein n=1 Tax=Mya arenaria TaxID=6604 RepID=A0ABY7FMI0_MYAAR|nr:hypothetical protein MAR_016115 [Mya arenaria]
MIYNHGSILVHRGTSETQEKSILEAKTDINHMNILFNAEVRHKCHVTLAVEFLCTFPVTLIVSVTVQGIQVKQGWSLYISHYTSHHKVPGTGSIRFPFSTVPQRPKALAITMALIFLPHAQILLSMQHVIEHTITMAMIKQPLSCGYEWVKKLADVRGSPWHSSSVSSTDRLPTCKDQRAQLTESSINSDNQSLILLSDNQSLILLSDNQSLILLSDNQSLILLSDNQSLILLSDSQSLILLSDNQSLILLSDNQSLILLSDSQSLILLSDSQSLILLSDSQSLILLSDSQSLVLLSESQSLILLSDNQLLILLSDSQSPILLSDSQSLILFSDSQSLILLSDSQSLILLSDNQSLILLSDSQSLILLSDSQSLILLSDNQSLILLSDNQSLILLSDSQSLILLSDSQSLILLSDSQSLILLSDSQSLVLLSDSQSLILLSESQSLILLSDSQSLILLSDSQSLILFSDSQSLILLSDSLPLAAFRLNDLFFKFSCFASIVRIDCGSLLTDLLAFSSTFLTGLFGSRLLSPELPFCPSKSSREPLEASSPKPSWGPDPQVQRFPFCERTRRIEGMITSEDQGVLLPESDTPHRAGEEGRVGNKFHIPGIALPYIHLATFLLPAGKSMALQIFQYKRM